MLCLPIPVIETPLGGGKGIQSTSFAARFIGTAALNEFR
jgi:hypothetical protein